MGNSHAARHILVVAVLRQVVNLSLSLVNIQFAIVIYHGNTCTVIATIFQTFQTLD